MNQEMVQRDRMRANPPSPRHNRHSHQPGIEAMQRGNKRPRTTYWNEDEQQVDDECIRVDLSSYSGDIFDHIWSSVTEDLDSSQDQTDREHQKDAFELFHAASGQLKIHCLKKTSRPHPLQRRNATRRSRNVRHSAISLRHEQYTDENGATNDQGQQLAHGPVPSNGYENTETESYSHEKINSTWFTNGQVLVPMNRSRLSRIHADSNYFAGESSNVPRPLSPCIEKGDHTVFPISEHEHYQHYSLPLTPIIYRLCSGHEPEWFCHRCMHW